MDVEVVESVVRLVLWGKNVEERLLGRCLWGNGSSSRVPFVVQALHIWNGWAAGTKSASRLVDMFCSLVPVGR